MTYIQWRDELNGCLGSMPADEKEKVFSYFAEMYADKRDAGLSEEEIVAEFGAPYDVAQRILNEEGYGTKNCSRSPAERTEKSESRKEQASGKNKKSLSAGGVVLIVLLCIVCFGPFVGLISAVFGITVGFIAAPIGIIVYGFCTIGAAIGGIVAGYAAPNILLLGIGLATVGAGFMLAPLFFKLISLIWALVKKLFNYIKSLCEREA